MARRSTTLRTTLADPYGGLTRAVLGALGLSAFAPAVACGGKAVIDAPYHGVGGSGGSGASPCDAELPSETAYFASACPFAQPAGPCPPPDSATALDAMTVALAKQECADFCCTSDEVVSVPCAHQGPDGECCYTAVMDSFTICEGRPFVVGGVARVAPAMRRNDWCRGTRAASHRADSALPRPDTTGLGEGEGAALAAAWLADALDEHASVAAFARFTLELLAYGAPAELVRLAADAVRDEIHHAELCFSLACRYGAESFGPGLLDLSSAKLARDLGDFVEAVALEGCVGESLNALVAAEAAAACGDVAVRKALEIIAADEARHAELAWRTLAWAVRKEHALVRRLRVVFDRVGPPAQSELVHQPAVGRLGASARRAVFERALREVVLPCAHALLAEGRHARTARALSRDA